MITITTPNESKLYFKGTSTAITSVFCRLQFIAPADGKTIEVSLFTYVSELDYNNGNSTIEIEGVNGFYTWSQAYTLSNGGTPETWKAQTIKVAHDVVKGYIDNLGYLATISGI
jgi:hypothetical protein